MSAHAASAIRTEKIVVLGMMTKMPVAGVIWQTVHYLVGLERLGYEVYYVEAHARTPSMFMETEESDGSGRAAAFIASVMDRFGLSDRWAYQALHADGALHGLSAQRLSRLYAEAALIINLHGGTQPREEHAATGRLVYLETDPVTLQIELAHDVRSSIDFLEPHMAFFTFGENLGKADCGLPVSDRFHFQPTRQPVVLDMWEGVAPARHDRFTTVGNWRQEWREVTYLDRTYHWSKHLEFEKFIELPSRTTQEFELALSSCDDGARAALERHGWTVIDGLQVSLDIDVYQRYIGASRAEFTVAKDQNVRLRSGWFSDRSATYLAAGRPVVTQDTGFGNHLPTGAGLFAFTTLEEAVEAVERIAADSPHHERAAAAVAHDYFGHDIVLGSFLRSLGMAARGRRSSIPGDLSLTPVSRRPLVLAPGTQRTTAELRPQEGPRDRSPGPVASIIIVTFDNLELTRLCLTSLFENTAEPAFEVVLVDNASTDGTPEYLEALAEAHGGITVIRNQVNLGFPAGTNLGVNAARGERLVFLNNDTLVPPGWLPRLLRHLDDPSVGAVGPVTNRIGNEAQIDTAYDTYAEFLALAKERGEEHRERAFDIPMLAMYCLALRRDVYDAVGPLDERYGRGLLEDDDYAARLRAAHLRSVCAEDVFVHHFGEASFGKLVSSGEYQVILQANQRSFREKWGEEWAPYGRRPSEAYDALVQDVVDAVQRYIPPHEPALMVSRGDERLVALDGHRLWHFPSGADGVWAGHYPANSSVAVRLLQKARRKGARYLVIPSTGAWWLDHYAGLRRHLDETAALIYDDPACCRIFRLGEKALRTDDVREPVAGRRQVV